MRNVTLPTLRAVQIIVLSIAGCTSSELFTAIPREYRQMVVVRDSAEIFRIDLAEDRAIPAGVLPRNMGDTITVLGFADVRRGMSRPTQRFALTVVDRDTVGIRIASEFFCYQYRTIALERLSPRPLDQLMSTNAVCMEMYSEYRRVRAILQYPMTFMLPRHLDSIAWARAATFMRGHEEGDRPITIRNTFGGGFSSGELWSDTELRSGDRKNRFRITRAYVGDSSRYSVACDTDLRNANTSAEQKEYEEILARRCAYFICTGSN